MCLRHRTAWARQRMRPVKRAIDEAPIRQQRGHRSHLCRVLQWPATSEHDKCPPDPGRNVLSVRLHILTCLRVLPGRTIRFMRDQPLTRSRAPHRDPSRSPHGVTAPLHFAHAGGPAHRVAAARLRAASLRLRGQQPRHHVVGGPRPPDHPAAAPHRGLHAAAGVAGPPGQHPRPDAGDHRRRRCTRRSSSCCSTPATPPGWFRSGPACCFSSPAPAGSSAPSSSSAVPSGCCRRSGAW